MTSAGVGIDVTYSGGVGDTDGVHIHGVVSDGQHERTALVRDDCSATVRAALGIVVTAAQLHHQVVAQTKHKRHLSDYKHNVWILCG